MQTWVRQAAGCEQKGSHKALTCKAHCHRGDTTSARAVQNLAWASVLRPMSASKDAGRRPCSLRLQWHGNVPHTLCTLITAEKQKNRYRARRSKMGWNRCGNKLGLVQPAGRECHTYASKKSATTSRSFVGAAAYDGRVFNSELRKTNA